MGWTMNNAWDGKDAPLALNDYIDLYKVFRGYVMEESGLINSRLVWIITINGFLFTTYGFTLQKEIEAARPPYDLACECASVDRVSIHDDTGRTVSSYDFTGRIRC